MTKKKKEIFYKLVFVMLFATILICYNEFRTNELNDAIYSVKPNKKISLNSFSWNLTGSPIIINDLQPDYNWSKTAAENGWCSGSGSWSDPYVIEDVLIDGLDGG